MTVKQSHDLCCRIEDEVERLWPQVQVTIHVEPKEDRASFDGRGRGGLCDRSGREGLDLGRYDAGSD